MFGTMKVITLVLAIVASVVAQEKKAGICLQLNSRRYSDAGYLDLSQSSPGANITISGITQKITPKFYVAVVHERRSLDHDCKNLGPIKTLGTNPPKLFIFTFANITTANMDDVSGYSLSATLQPRRSNSINRRVIALYDIETFDFFKKNPSTDAMACGLVEMYPAHYDSFIDYMSKNYD